MPSNARVWIAAAAAAAAGCSVLFLEDPVTPPTNRELIRESAVKAARAVAAAPVFGGEKVIVASMERPDQSDLAVQAEVEDALVEALKTAGLPVLERDPDVLVRMAYQEGTPTLEYFVMAHGDTGDRRFDPHGQALLKVEGHGTTWVFESGPVTGHEPIPTYTFDAPRPFHVASARIDGRQLSALSTADLIVAYRLLEAGVQYRDSPYRNRGARVIERHAETRIHVRVVRARSGEIIWARTVTGEERDLIPQDAIAKAERPGRLYYPATLPLQPGDAAPAAAAATEPVSERSYVRETRVERRTRRYHH